MLLSQALAAPSFLRMKASGGWCSCRYNEEGLSRCYLLGDCLVELLLALWKLRYAAQLSELSKEHNVGCSFM